MNAFAKCLASASELAVLVDIASRTKITGCMCELVQKLKLHAIPCWRDGMYGPGRQQRWNISESPCLSEQEQPETH